VFYLAVTQLEYAEWLARQGRAEAAEPLLTEAREIFERLGARPWLERAAQPVGVRQQAEAVTQALILLQALSTAPNRRVLGRKQQTTPKTAIAGVA
jgi:hypothetical protein